MKCLIEIDMENLAIQDDITELAELLEHCVSLVRRGELYSKRSLFDNYGELAGWIRFEEDE